MSDFPHVNNALRIRIALIFHENPFGQENPQKSTTPPIRKTAGHIEVAQKQLKTHN